VRKALAADPRLVETALTGGDDYEILAAVPAAERNAFARAAAEADIPVAEIGAFAAGEPGVSVTGPDGAPMSFAHGSYTHF